VAGKAQSAEPGRGLIPHGGIFPASRPKPVGRLPAADEKLGPAGATVATAHKIAIIFYTMVKKQVEYDETLWAQRDAEREKRFEAKLKRQAQQLGLQTGAYRRKPAA